MSGIGTNSKHCDFTFALSDISQAERVISELPDFDIWAYIKHQPDDDNGSEHYHFYIHLKQPITIKALSEKLEVPPNFLEWVRVKTRLIQYLIHKNQPEKIQYQDSAIQTNNREYINKFLNPQESSTNILSEFSDLSAVANGKITPYAYLDNHSDSISSLPFYSRQLFLMRLINLGKEGIQTRKEYFGRVV